MRTNPTIFAPSAGPVALFLILLPIFPDQTNLAFTHGRSWEVTDLGRFFILGVSLWLVFLLVLACSRFDNVRLCNENEQPTYSDVS